LIAEEEAIMAVADPAIQARCGGAWPGPRL